MGEEMVVTSFRALSCHSPESVEENYKIKPSEY
jgi:hypothetical protein